MSERWRARADAHAQRVDRFVGPHLRRTRAGQSHPVWDFLFSYYSLRPGQLRCWHPGYGVLLAGDDAVRRYRHRRGYILRDRGVTVGPDYLRDRLEAVRFIAGLLRATARRAPVLNCFGLHEWAMVYRSEGVRRHQVPLRLVGAATDAVVDSSTLRCTHFDALRFFTPQALPRNAVRPGRATQAHWEQPGCLHANMDLYKWCYKLSPLVDSELLLDCLELAAAAREVDMRASPYDLREYGYRPIRVEDPAGRAEYARHQRGIAERAAPLRAALLARCDLLVRVAECG